MVKKSKKLKKPCRIALNCRTARKERGFTQDDVVDLVDILLPPDSRRWDRQKVGELESGHNCKHEGYELLAKALGISLEELSVYHLFPPDGRLVIIKTPFVKKIRKKKASAINFTQKTKMV